MSIGGAFNIIGVGPQGLYKSKAGGNTARTAAFLTASGITDSTIISALNAMDDSLISAGLLPAGTGAGKIKALYPFVGATANTHKFNFVNPLDTNAAFRLEFYGGWTHSANGALPNGTNAYADTFIRGNIDINNINLHISFYSRTNNLTNGYEFAVDNDNLSLICNYLNSGLGFCNYKGFNNFAVSNSLGLYALSFNLTILKGYKNNINVVNVVKTPTSFTNKTLFLCADNRGITSEFSSKQVAYVTFGNALTDVEHTNLNNINTSFQTTLGRAV